MMRVEARPKRTRRTSKTADVVAVLNSISCIHSAAWIMGRGGNEISVIG
jgi:hypothetical protein